MLRYALEGVGATDISWNGESKTATFSYKGTQMNVNVGAENVINGRSVVDSYGLANIFKENGFDIDQEEFVPTEETRFESAEDAALAFGLKYYEQAVRERQEYGASIAYIINEDLYVFENVAYSLSGESKMQGYGDERDMVNINTKSKVIGGKTIGLVHIHWNKNGLYNDFSPADKLYWQVEIRKGNFFTYYLYNHNGFFKGFYDHEEYANRGGHIYNVREIK